LVKLAALMHGSPRNLGYCFAYLCSRSPNITNENS